jgi:NADH-quinone oxidoreductase subunit M
MILLLLLILLGVGGALAAMLGSWRPAAPRWVALATTGLGLVLSVVEWTRAGAVAVASPWIDQYQAAWLPSLGARFYLALDGLSLLMILLTFFLGVLAVAVSWEVRDRPGLFFLNLLWMLAGIVGIFLALNLFLFYVAWEVMLVPLYFLIALWGGERRAFASTQFFLFTQLSGLLMLISILALEFARQPAGRTLSLDYGALLGVPLSVHAGIWIMLGFLAAFAVKLPLFPLHTWQPEAFVAAPAGACITGLLIEIGGYGLIRFLLPLFPAAAHAAAPIVMTLAVVGILYGAWMALGQRDLKRLIAYGSVAHVGFVALGIFAWNRIALQGAVVLMIAHALSTGALFILVSLLRERTRSAGLDPLGGIWSIAPSLSAATLFFLLASIGLPGLADFVGEFLVLLGVYPVSHTLAALAALGVLFSTLYALRLVQRAFWGPEQRSWDIPDLTRREWAVLTPLALALVIFGIYPRPILGTFRPALEMLMQIAPPGLQGYSRAAQPPILIRHEAKTNLPDHTGVAGGAR